MFTGIIQAVGEIVAVESVGGDARLRIDTGVLDLAGAGLGDSIAVNGVCLTAVEFSPGGFVADVSQETLSLTTLGNARQGSRVNLEPALTLATPLGGHLVSGHVDGIGKLLSMDPDARSTRMEFEVPIELSRYVARKGSITIDGTSLTVNAVEGEKFSVNIVPHTLERTIMGGYTAGAHVNLEVDLVARYLERLLRN
jgi:riboflavin synthase